MSNPLSARKGVNPSFVWLSASGYTELLDFLCERFPAQGREVWVERMSRGDVLDSEGNALPVDAPYIRGNKIFYFREIEQEPAIPFDYQLLYEDELILVVDKPHFLPVIPTGRYVSQTLISRLRHDFNEPGLQAIHRLDRDTAGVIVIARRPQDRAAYHVMFQQRAVCKVYEAIAPIVPDLVFPLVRRSRIVEAARFFMSAEEEGEINAETRIDLLKRSGDRAYYRLEPVSGKKHQLRVHMMALGAPIENDALYPVALPAETEDYDRPLQLLARSIGFVDPVCGVDRQFESRLQLNWP